MPTYPADHACVLTLLAARYKQRDFFLGGMAGLMTAFDVLSVLVAHYLPALHSHLGQNCTPMSYAMNWLLTMFVSDVPLTCAARLWDVFFVRGYVVFYQVHP